MGKKKNNRKGLRIIHWGDHKYWPHFLGSGWRMGSVWYNGKLIIDW